MNDIDSPDKKLSKEDRKVWESFTQGMRKERDAELLPEENFENLLNEGGDKKFIDDGFDKGQKPVPVLKSSGKEKNIADTFQLDRRTEEKLRKGKIPLEGRLDLHGMRQDEAYEALNNFIEEAIKNKKRCVLVITGKGKSKSTSADWLTPAQGVLKMRAPEWLSSPSLARYVLKFYPAVPAHGGSGALYVYLKRQR